MGDTPDTPPDYVWQPKPTFSEKFNVNNPITEAPRKTAPSAPSSPEQSAPNEASTAPITLPFVPERQPINPFTQQEQINPFRILSPEELTPQEVREMQKRITADYYGRKLFEENRREDPPSPYVERYYIWKMIFQQLIPVGVLVLVFTVTLMILSSGVPQDVLPGVIIFLAIVLLVCAWVSYRIFFAWNHTAVFSDLQETGIRRRPNRLLLLTEINMTQETVSLATKEAKRGLLAQVLNLNCWRVDLDSPSQQDKFLAGLTFVRNGGELRNTVAAFQRYQRK